MFFLLVRFPLYNRRAVKYIHVITSKAENLDLLEQDISKSWAATKSAIDRKGFRSIGVFLTGLHLSYVEHYLNNVLLQSVLAANLYLWVGREVECLTAVCQHLVTTVYRDECRQCFENSFLSLCGWFDEAFDDVKAPLSSHPTLYFLIPRLAQAFL